MDIKLQKIKNKRVWSTLELRAKICHIKTPPLPVFTPHADTQIINNIKTTELSPSLEIWAIFAPLQYHLVPFKPNEYNGDRDPPHHHLHESTEREEGSVGWELSLLLAITAAHSKCATKESSHQQGEAWCSAWQCGFFLMHSSLHFKLCSSKKKMRKT